MRYYIYILMAVLLTTITFCVGKKYQVKVGTMRIASAFYNLLTGAFTFVIFWIANGALISITPFSLFIATVVSICGIAYSFIGFKLMAYGKYSVYVMYLMVGGMALPFLYGWIVLGEPISPMRVIGLLLLTVLLILLNQKPTEKAKYSPWVYRLLCVAVFLLNGAVSMFLKMHQVNTTYETLPTIPYNILSAMMGIACSGVWAFAELIRSQRNAATDAGLLPKDMCCRIVSMLPWILLSSIAGATSSFLMLHSASHVDASVLYPMVTGGTVVLSALAGYVVFGEKQTKKDTVLYILCLIAIMTLLLTLVIFPVSVAAVYTMDCTIYYTDESGNTLAPAASFTLDASDTDETAIARPSPSITGYALKYSTDANVTFAMMEKYYPASNYVRSGTATYTVVYEKLHAMTGQFLYSDGRMAASPITVYGKAGTSFHIQAPTVTDFAPDKTSITGRFLMEEDYDTVYYHRIYYTITYDANGGSGAPADGSKGSGIPHQLSTTVPTKYGYDFVGWAKSATGTAVYDAGEWINDDCDLTLYAQWAPKTYTISFDANGGSNAPAAQTKYYGTALVLSSQEPTKSGYDFLGWSTNSTATTASFAAGSNFRQNRDITLYAVWEKIPEEYAVRYNANGGSNAPATQTKIEGKSLTLTIDIPSRAGYSFQGWGTTSTTKTVSYIPGGAYNRDASITLYAIWSPNIYTVSYDANGGSGAPANQYKTHNVPLTLSGAEPTRYRYKFLGWAASSTATSPDYYSGGIYDENSRITFYAVWEYINYDLSVSDLTITPNSVYQYDTVTVRFRLDSWDQKNAYSGIPVTVCLNGSQIHSTTVDFRAYGVNYVSFELNVGTLLGNQMIEARVNWEDHENETRTTNNSTKGTFHVDKWIEVSADYVTANGGYTEGTEVITTFYFTNDAASDILPEDGVTFDFVVYTMNSSGTETIIVTQTQEGIVCPSNGFNIVYFKWTVPDNSAGILFWCQGTINSSFKGEEQITDNNTTFFTFTAKSKVISQSPNTRYEGSAPSSYNPSVSSPTTSTGKATWTMWVYENGDLILKSFGLSITTRNPVVKPDDGCLTATFIGGRWTMKSGYGINLEWNPVLTSVSGCEMPSSDSYTSVQSVYARFPEFNYLTEVGKYRTLERNGKNFMFVENSDADGGDRVHFIPVYVKNGNYIVSVTATEIWTPAGMITAARNANTLIIDGTIYDDWYQG